MDSCNSESLQSSSGDEEEYDSSRSANLLTSTSSLNFNHSSHNIPPPPSPFFDSLSSYLSLSPPPTLDYPPPSYINCTTTTTSAAVEPKSPPPPPLPPARSSKKRSRASRRAPTTVLTTDTTNFRAMVQEFTGIPTPPFAASLSSFSRPRLDLLSAAGPSYPLRPFLHKLTSQLPPRPFPPPPLGGATTSGVISNATNMENNSLFSLQSLLQPSLAPPKYTNCSTAGGGLIARPPSDAAIDQCSPLMWMDGLGGGQDNGINGVVQPPRQNAATTTAPEVHLVAPPRSGGLDSYITWSEWRKRGTDGYNLK